ncbi:hypothetical protein Tco_0999799 [Tanacetum coccineum]
MAAESTVPQLVDKKGGSYSNIAPRLEPRKFNKLKKRMLYYLTALKTYTRYKNLLNELSNDSVTLSKLEINVGFMNNLIEKLLSFSQGLKYANHTHTLDLADIHGRFVYEDNLIQRRYPQNKKALITTTSTSLISTAFFSNNIVQDFQENSDDEADEIISEEYLRDLELEFHERSLLANSKLSNISSVSKVFQPKFTPKHIQSSQQAQSSQNEPKIQKDYKAEYKKMKSKLALFEASLSTSQSLKTFQSKNKGLVAKTFDWDEEEASDDEEMTQVKVLTALADDKLLVGMNHARNGEWINITMRKVNILLSMDEDADWKTYLKYINIDLKFVEEQRLDPLSKYNKIIQNTKLTKLNYDLQEQLTEERKVNEKWLTSSKKRHIREPIWYMDSGCSTSMTGVMSYLHKYVEKLGPKDHLGKFDATADDGYFLGYSFVPKAFRVFNTRRQQIEETYHVTFNESMETIKFTSTSVDEIEIDDSSRYLPDEFVLEDDPSRQYQTNFDFSYYMSPHGRSLTELLKDTHVPEVITPNKENTPQTKDVLGLKSS